MFRGTVHVIVGSGLTIVGAVACLYFTRLPYFQTLGVPAALGVLVTLMAALTLGPAVVMIATRFGLLEPKRKVRAPGWRRIGHRHRPVARAHPRRVVGHRRHRCARAAGGQDQLRRQALPSRHRAGQRRVRGRRAALLRGPAEPRTVDDRIRSRHAESVGHADPRARRQGRAAHPGHCPGAVDHPTPGHANHPQLHTLSDQRPERRADHESQLPAGQGSGHHEAGRSDHQVDRHPAATARAAEGECRRNRRAGPGVPRHRDDHQRGA